MQSKYPIYHFDVKQNSEEWDDLRLGKITGSKAILLKPEGRNEFKLGTGAITYAYKLAAERLTGWQNESDSFKSEAMERGNDFEPYAIEAYQEKTFNQVKKVGFVEYSKTVGCSPDGLVGSDGLIEVKTRDNHLFLETVVNEIIKPIDIWQMQFNLFITGRIYCDYIVYNSTFKEKGLWVKRVMVNEEIAKTIELKIKSLDLFIEQIIQKFEKSIVKQKRIKEVLPKTR